jgi:ketosteroid isomerase-like protein
VKILACAVLLVCTATPFAGAQSADLDAQSRIIVLERVARQAGEAKDLKTLDQIMDGSFVYVDVKGRLRNKAEALAFIQSDHPLQITVAAMTVRVHGDTAIATGVFKAKRVERGRPILNHVRFVDTWLHKDGRWVIIAKLSTPVGD